MEDFKALTIKYALINATEHNGVANSKSVLGKLLADNPEMRSQVLQLRSAIDDAVNEVNRWDIEKQKKELDSLGGYVEPKKIEKKGLPDLDVGRKFVIRFAPNPGGCLHLGNARPAVLCNEYAKKYKGKFVLRFDDTDPKVKISEKKFYSWIKEDLRWLGIKWHAEIIASKRLNLYYTFATKLVKNGKAYVCTCNRDAWKRLRDKGKACECRREDEKTAMRKWRKMLAANKGKGYKEGEAVLRVKTDMDAKNPAVIDWPAFRVVDKPNHPFSRKRLWPLYNFASAIDDRLCGTTHIFRGQEHSTNEVKQRYLYQHLGWKYPQTIILGRFALADMVLSKSTIRKDIASKKFSGWDDIRLGTLRALKRRGFQPEAIRQIILDIGVKPSDITVSFENLSAYNRKIIDRVANRFFFVPNPKRIEVKKLNIRSIKIPVHPDNRKKFREIKLDSIFYIDNEDFEKYKGLEVRLKDLGNIKLGEISVYTGNEAKSVPRVQWVPKKHLYVRVFLPNKEIKGYGEMNLAKAKVGDIVQFERFGFVRIEKVSKSNISVVFSHM
ncbi:MAG: glutamate--tRNA ligase [Candidatus Aenigmatarchaeota archaeon]